jgi:hypothetical protein
MRLVPKRGAGEVVISFPGSRTAQIEPLDKLPFHINSIRGSAPDRWVMNAEAWSRLRYRQIEPGVGLVIHPAESAREWEYDFEIAPGADPSLVEFDVHGAASLTVDEHGDLEARTQDGNTVRWHRPASGCRRNGPSTSSESAQSSPWAIQGRGRESIARIGAFCALPGLLVALLLRGNALERTGTKMIWLLARARSTSCGAAWSSPRSINSPPDFLAAVDIGL